VTPNSRPVVPLRLQVRFRQPYLEACGGLNLLRSFTALGMRGMSSFRHACPRPVPDPYPSVCMVPGCESWHDSSHFFFPFLADIRHGRRCSVSRLPDQDFRRCPIATAPDIFCGCGQHTCGKCSAACRVCEKKGQAADTLRQQLLRASCRNGHAPSTG